MSAVKSRPKRTPKVPIKIRSIQTGDSNDSYDQGRLSQLSLASNGFEDISSDSNSSFDQNEFEQECFIIDMHVSLIVHLKIILLHVLRNVIDHA